MFLILIKCSASFFKSQSHIWSFWPEFHFKLKSHYSATFLDQKLCFTISVACMQTLSFHEEWRLWSPVINHASVSWFVAFIIFLLRYICIRLYIFLAGYLKLLTPSDIAMVLKGWLLGLSKRNPSNFFCLTGGYRRCFPCHGINEQWDSLQCRD